VFGQRKGAPVDEHTDRIRRKNAARGKRLWSRTIPYHTWDRLRHPNEAAIAHWSQESAELPDWDTAERRMADSGRLSKVKHPSADQEAGRLDFIRKRAINRVAG
jgi:hypothetical protein